MADSLLVAVTSGASQVAFSEELTAATKAFIIEAHSDRTRQAYRRAWLSFERWCASQGASSFPASPETVAAWLASLASGIGHPKPLARSSINQALSAVLLAHRTAGMPLDRKHPLISETWHGIARVKARTDSVRKAKPVLGSDLSAMIDGLGQRPIDVRDRALLSLGWAGALRRSELVGLDWMSKGAGQGFVSIDDEAVTILSLIHI